MNEHAHDAQARAPLTCWILLHFSSKIRSKNAAGSIKSSLTASLYVIRCNFPSRRTYRPVQRDRFEFGSPVVPSQKAAREREPFFAEVREQVSSISGKRGQIGSRTTGQAAYVHRYRAHTVTHWDCIRDLQPHLLVSSFSLLLRISWRWQLVTY